MNILELRSYMPLGIEIKRCLTASKKGTLLQNEWGGGADSVITVLKKKKKSLGFTRLIIHVFFFIPLNSQSGCCLTDQSGSAHFEIGRKSCTMSGCIASFKLGCLCAHLMFPALQLSVKQRRDASLLRIWTPKAPSRASSNQRRLRGQAGL